VDREPRDKRDLDDWFVEPEPLPEEWAPHTHEHGEAELEDWLHEPERPLRKRTRLSGKRRVAAATALLCLLLLIGLVAGGVFSGRSERAPTPSAAGGPTGGFTASSASAPFTPPTPRPAATTRLKRGARGPQVIALQRALTRLGYYSGRIDGQYGPGTENAVSRFQAASGLTPDGILGPLTRRGLTSALRR
jgi:Putative peptidoglycan binding domain